ncbi:hypothetical protein [Vibrio fluvialis]|uniref:hypothetical protein n=1 Tax=Vibrio fluvialis TaxID=676 RepID=UPI001EEA66CA|nr:hypothetical protein [Vibrio fluvialis]MCG6387563.1 hypothetical protein [Vibrio fluvialis]
MNTLNIPGLVFAQIFPMSTQPVDIPVLDESKLPGMDFYHQLLDNRVGVERPVETTLPEPSSAKVPWSDFGGCYLHFHAGLVYAVDVESSSYVVIVNNYGPIDDEFGLVRFLTSVNAALDFGYQQGVSEGRREKVAELKKVLSFDDE